MDINFIPAKTHDKIAGWAFQVFAFCIPLSQSLGIKALVALFVYCIYIVVASGKFAVLLRQGWDSGLYLLVLVIGLTYTKDNVMGWKVIESSLSLIALPVIFCTAGPTLRKNYFRIFSAFTAGLLVACVICLASAGWDFFSKQNDSAFFYDKLTSVIHFQPTYVSYYLIFSITLLIYTLYYDRIRTSWLVPVAALLILFPMLLLTGGLTSMISLVFIFSFFILKFLQEQKSAGKKMAIALVLLMTIGMFTLNSADRNDSSGIKNDYWERAVLWESALRATPDIVWGVGTGDFTLVLNKYYQEHHLERFAQSNSNSHNEFTQVLFSNGLPGLCALLILLGRPLYASVVNRNILGILTFFPFFIYGVTEVFLGRYQGVIFFMFLHQTFTMHYEGQRPAFSLKNPIF